MQYLTLDFETYYDKNYSLSKKDITTQDYIMSTQFAPLMASLKFGENPAYVVEAENLAAHFATLDWADIALVNHNSIFDASILWWRYGYRPAMLIDTMSMAQSLGVPLLTGSASLDKCIGLLREAGYQVPQKGKEVISALGKHRSDFTSAEWEAYKQYCLKDTEITWFLFKVLKQFVPNRELQYQDMMLRCYTEPMLKVHQPTVEYELARAKLYKEQQLTDLCKRLGVSQDAISVKLRSNDKFAILLRDFGGVTQAEADGGAVGKFIIPQKVSEITGKLTWAFGKKDVAFKDLCEMDDPDISVLCQARLAAKSSIDETRAAAFLKYAAHGFLPMGYKIGGAHTNRASGGSAGSANMQNLPAGRRKGQTDLLRRSIVAHDGMAVVNYDASQIEARVLCYVAGQDDVLDLFAKGEDVYSDTAATLYGVPYAEIVAGRKSNDPETAAHYTALRFGGKTANLGLGYGQGYVGYKNYALLTGGINIDLTEAKRIVTLWRRKYHKVANFWKLCETALKIMMNGGQMVFGGRDDKLVFADGTRQFLGRRVPGIRMPNGLWLNYPNLRYELLDGKQQMVYDKVGYNGKPVVTKVYGSLVTENIVQAIAFAVLKEQGLQIHARYPIKMNTHDEWVAVVYREQVTAAAAFMQRCMTTPPTWLEGIPLGTEGGWAQSYGGVDDNWGKRPDNPNRIHRFDPNTGKVY